MRRRTRKRLTLLLIVAAVWAAAKKPGDEGRSGIVTPDDGYFAALEPLVRQECHGLPCAMIDLDRLDANIKLVRSRIRAPRRLRVVVKSLPSLELLSYVLEKADTRRLMVFHAPHIPLLVRALGDVDLLLGKPMPAAAARQVLTELPAAAEKTQWLIDTPELLTEYAQLARDLKTRLRVSLEIDVGLHRGGARDEGELKRLLEQLKAAQGALRFAGLMGYDGHVSHTPALFGLGSRDRAMSRTFKVMLERYRALYAVAKAAEPAWFDPPAEPTLNGGGSHTYAFYEPLGAAETPINNLALGSAFVKPADFEDSALAQHQRAMFLALPILKRLSSPPLPFMDAFWGLATAWDPNVARGFYIYGAVWDSQIVYPRGLRPGWFYEPEIRNLLPNQSLLSGSTSVKAEVGDYVFLHPREGDAIAVYHEIIGVRGAHVDAHWHPIPLLN